MKYFLVVTFVTVVRCRPEAGYDYRPGYASLGPQNVGIISNGPKQFQIGSIGSSFGGSSATGGTGFGVSEFGIIGKNQISGGDLGHTTNFNLIDGSSINSGSFGSGGPALVQKHIYVHVPPPDQEELSFQRHKINLGERQKHYKIIFIKAPSYGPSLDQQQISLASQSQEKTIVYVLVKKPEDISDISVPAIAPTQPNKPEVYFIKYKAQKENIVDGTNSGSISSGLSGIGGQSFVDGTGISSSSQALISGGTSTGFVGGIGSGHGGSVISSGSASSSIGGIPAPQYGPPGKSGPY